MELIQLKMPPERLKMIVKVIERDLIDHPADEDRQSLMDILVWMRYRLSRYGKNHPTGIRD